MSINSAAFFEIRSELEQRQVQLVAVSKTKSVEDILELYGLGQRDFGENYVQELVDKAARLPTDIRWHFIGHLQSNKVKYIAPFVHLVQGVDSHKLLREIDKQAAKCNRKIDCLLQVHIAQEETKFGMDEEELDACLQELMRSPLRQVRVTGLMGMASFTADLESVREEFANLSAMFTRLKKSQPDFSVLSMGMSSDYRLAVESGSTMVRIGSLLFGEREKP